MVNEGHVLWRDKLEWCCCQPVNQSFDWLLSVKLSINQSISQLQIDWFIDWL